MRYLTIVSLIVLIGCIGTNTDDPSNEYIDSDINIQDAAPNENFIDSDSNININLCFNETPDGVLSDGEECDDFNFNNEDRCTNYCRLNICGDGILFIDIEECDDRIETDYCNSDCTLSQCGDGLTNIAANETCDDGNEIQEDYCLNNCVHNTCGDGFLNPDTEECDLKENNSNNGDCLINCMLPICGDGFLYVGTEECDPGFSGITQVENTEYMTRCNSNCRAEEPICGDGIINQDFEQCDSSNVDTEECNQNCTLNVCGDGYINITTEECDDRNDINNDECSNQCVFLFCGDGIVQINEWCDAGDQNGENSFCSAGCRIQPEYYSWFTGTASVNGKNIELASYQGNPDLTSFNVLYHPSELDEYGIETEARYHFNFSFWANNYRIRLQGEIYKEGQSIFETEGYLFQTTSFREIYIRVYTIEYGSYGSYDLQIQNYICYCQDSDPWPTEDTVEIAEFSFTKQQDLDNSSSEYSGNFHFRLSGDCGFLSRHEHATVEITGSVNFIFFNGNNRSVSPVNFVLDGE